MLLGAGLWILREALEDEDEMAEALEKARQGGAALLLIALGVSLDELAVGLALGALRLPVLPVVIAVGAQALAVSLLGLRLGAALGTRAGTRAMLLAGMVRCAIAVRLGVTNLVGR